VAPTGGRFKTRRWLLVLAIAAGLVVVASVVTLPVRSAAAGRPLLSGANVDGQVLGILDRACRDCHSEATRYPWYSYVAPVSWLVRSDVVEGRRHLNLSQWDAYSMVRKQRSLSEIANQIKDRNMPLWQYTLIHSGAKLSDADVDLVFQWTQRERMRLITEAR
jgi:Haem-binding domain